jgi:hypothetical protein
MMPHGTRSNWRVNAQPSSGPSAGRVSPDPEQHHPDLGTAQKSAEQAERTAAGTRSPSPGPGAESQNAWMPRRLPDRPHSPSNAYVPRLNADRGTESRLRAMVDHTFENLEPHPAMPAGPTGEITLGREHSDALLAFRNQVLAQPDHSRQYAQTYRIEDGRFVPNHPALIEGQRAEVAMPGGSYPAGTGLVIRSFNADHASGLPGEADLLRAYQDRTNFLHHPDTQVASHILFNPRDDSAYMFDGTLDAHGTPQYFGLAVSPQSVAEPVAHKPALSQATPSPKSDGQPGAPV